MAVLKGNQVILESKIQEQNDSIDAYLQKQEQISFQLNSLESEKNEALRQVGTLRDKFSKHDMNSLALAKPKLIETRVNNGTQKLKVQLIKMTDPNQFDPKEDVSRGTSDPVEVPDAPASVRG